MKNVVGQTAESFEQLRILLKAGDVISVTDAAGAISTGEIVALSNSSLRLRVGAVTRELPQADVLKIEQRRRDSLGNGALYGFVVGRGFAAIGVMASCGDDSFVNFCDGAGSLAIIGIWGGLGAGVGIGIDALIVRPQTIYRVPAAVLSRLRFTPLLSAKPPRCLSVGVTLTVETWKRSADRPCFDRPVGSTAVRDEHYSPFQGPTPPEPRPAASLCS